MTTKIQPLIFNNKYNKKYEQEQEFARSSSEHKTIALVSKTDLDDYFVDEQIIKFIEKEKQCLCEKHEKKLFSMKKFSQTQKKKLEDEILILQDQLTRRTQAVEKSTKLKNIFLNEKQILFDKNHKLSRRFEELQKRNQALEEKHSKLKNSLKVNTSKQNQIQRNNNQMKRNQRERIKDEKIKKHIHKSLYREKNRRFSLSDLNSNGDHERDLNNKSFNNFPQRPRNYPKSNSVSEVDFQTKRRKSIRKRRKNTRGSWKDWFGISNQTKK
ncbi:hypothetical protein M0812_22019 [Anaeramoeba flamelloides]|uniref:Uncharacterized protein n=1 Tax=Anaeramoeba flamelloides TaxID=1746091 RepID=A0AAV7YWE7_9EUKA|nr:hypothetical protein M0812_22019 [Anaeramoeba flamelloides]